MDDSRCATLTSTAPEPRVQPGEARVCFVIVFFGQWPRWIDYFLLSCQQNPQFHWRIFTDCPIDRELPANVIVSSIEQNEVERLIQERILPAFTLSSAYKLCDIKPAYGEIFAEHLRDYEFWGYTDLDIILGNLCDFFTPDILNRHDVLTACTHLVAGHCTILRNESRFNRLFRECEIYQQKFLLPDYRKFDEGDFSDHVKAEHAKQNLRFYERDIIREDAMIWWSGRPRFLISWSQGRLVDVFSFKEIAYFHFIHSKRREYFQFSPLPDEARRLIIDRNGCFALSGVGAYARFLKSFFVTLAFTLPWYVVSVLERVMPPTLHAKFKRMIGMKGMPKF